MSDIEQWEKERDLFFEMIGQIKSHEPKPSTKKVEE